MTTMFDVPAEDLIKKTSEELKKMGVITPPQWASYAKTGVHKERAPEDPDWWYMRAASMLRKACLLGPVGVSKLRRKYGGRKNRGSKPEHFFKGSGNILRKIFRQLETAGLVQKSKTSRPGRMISPKGRSLLDKTAAKIARERPKPKKPEAKEKKPVVKERPVKSKSEKKPEAKPKEAPEKKPEAKPKEAPEKKPEAKPEKAEDKKQ